jgi:glycosyltransferase involved in cell wall biosynthesis
MKRIAVDFVTIVPSPYQRDLFRALASRDEVDLSVHYLEASSPDSPWPQAALARYERIMPGFWLPLGADRVHVNWGVPDFRNADVVVLSSFTSITGQLLMRGALKRQRWVFWGERLRRRTGWRERVRERLAAPLAEATAIVGIGGEAMTAYARQFPGSRHYSVPYHCDLDAFSALPRRPKPRSKCTFLFCGQMIPRKGIDVLLTAFDDLVKDQIDAELLLAGREADLPQFLSAVSEATRSRIHFDGFLAPDNLPELMQRADVFVLPSRHDGWGVVVNQAAAAGLPLLVSDAVGARVELVEEGLNGFIVPAGDATALGQRMKWFVKNGDCIPAFGAASRQKARTMTPNAGASKWVNVLREVLS